MKLREIDTKILTALRRGEDAKLIAKSLKLPKSTVYYHLGKMKRAGVIRGVRVSMNFEQTGDYQSAAVLVSLTSTSVKDMKTFVGFIQKSKFVSDIYVVSGDWDYLLVISGTKKELNDFLISSLQGTPFVKRTQSLFIIKHIEV